jgi:hypothetical protein
MNLSWIPPRPESQFSAAMKHLRDAGFQLDPSDIPGLIIVTGHRLWGAELTMNQIIDLARRNGLEASEPLASGPP